MICSSLNLVFFTSVSSRSRTLAQTGGVSGEHVSADLIDVSAGETSVEARPIHGRMFQTPFSDRIRNEANCPTMTVGNIYEADHVNSILAAGRADLVALGRPHLIDPAWTARAAATVGYRGVAIPKAYASGQAQLARTLHRLAITA
ncbi:MAG: hypothetical protein DI605_18995, partial [Sphingomonas sp.]